MAWSDLPTDLLCCISSRLAVVDVLRSSIVCTSWNFALTNNIKSIHSPLTPWMLLPRCPEEAPDTLTFHDFTIEEESCSGRHHHFSLGNSIFRRRCLGSKDGWLVTLHSNSQPRLLNPLTKAEISLPSLFAIPKDQLFWEDPDASNDPNNMNVKRIKDLDFDKIVLSSNDLSGTAVAIYRFNKSMLALAKLRDDTWVLGPELPPCDISYFDQFNDVYFHEEEQRFYAITWSSAVTSFDLNGNNIKSICSGTYYPPTISYYAKNYIGFLSGTLIKIVREIKYTESLIDINYKTIGIYVYKFVSDVAVSSCPSSQWISVKDLGGCSLFIGYNQTFSLHHTLAPRIRPNCIYFSNNFEGMSPNADDYDAGLFDLHNDCFEYFYDSNSNPTSIWFTPSLF